MNSSLKYAALVSITTTLCTALGCGDDKKSRAETEGGSGGQADDDSSAGGKSSHSSSIQGGTSTASSSERASGGTPSAHDSSSSSRAPSSGNDSSAGGTSAASGGSTSGGSTSGGTSSDCSFGCSEGGSVNSSKGGESTAGGSTSACIPSNAFPARFDFNDNASLGTASEPGEGVWNKMRQTSTARGETNYTSMDPENLAYTAKLEFDAEEGDPNAGALKATIPFTGTHGRETLSLVYQIAGWHHTDKLVNMVGRHLSARIKLVDNPHASNCFFTAVGWADGDTGTLNEIANRVEGGPTFLTAGTWSLVQFDLDASVPVDRVNQFGINLQALCSGATTGSGNTVILVDTVELGCD